MSLTVVLLEPRRVSIACIKSTKETCEIMFSRLAPWKLLLRAIIGYPFLIQQKGRCLTLVNLFTKACFVLSILHAVFILISYKQWCWWYKLLYAKQFCSTTPSVSQAASWPSSNSILPESKAADASTPSFCKAFLSSNCCNYPVISKTLPKTDGTNILCHCFIRIGRWAFWRAFRQAHEASKSMHPWNRMMSLRRRVKCKDNIP